MDLGTHYSALAVKDIKTSKEFYEKLRFSPVENGGSVEEKWLVMANGNNKIGLFQDMFPKNTLTFNPQNAREVYKKVKEGNIKVDYASKNIEEEKGACSFAITDPDGNPVLFDQHND